ncbi:hypothetical protein ACQVTR_29700, partial [Bacillus paranthracis]
MLRNIIGKINCQESINPCALGGQTLVDRDYNAYGERVLWFSTKSMRTWTVDRGATVQLISGENKALFLPHWDSSAAQNVQITNFDEDTEYTLRVRGKGKGKITIQHGTTGEQVETMVFSQK